ncbi:endodeoxyribonuclease [Microsporum audouinii]
MEPLEALVFKKSSCSQNEGKVVENISKYLISVLEELSRPNGRPYISLKRRSKQSGYTLNPETGALESSDEVHAYTYSWPGKTTQEGWRFGVLMRILGLISEAIDGNFTSSKRDIFYQDPVYFGSQKLVDRYVDDIAFTFGVDRAALHVGKGYPDVSSREFLRLLSQSSNQESSFNLLAANPAFASLPVYILVDSDPDGMAIMSTYKYGSMAQVHQNAYLNVPSIQWIGLYASEMISTVDFLNGSSLIPMSRRDRKKAEAMLNRNPCFAEDGPEPSWRKELQSLLVMNMKAEIEILYECDGGIEGWLDGKLSKLG